MIKGIDLSIIVPIHNAELYIERLVSTLVQIKEIVCEIHLVENNSTDDTSKILRQIKNTYSNEKIYIYSIDATSSGEALNYGLERVKGKYVYMCDADDEVIPKAFERQFEQIQKDENFAADIISCKYMTIKGNEIISIKPKDLEFTNTYWNKIYSTDFLKRNNIKFIEGINVQDGCFNTDVINFLPKVYFSPNIIYKYYIGVDSISDTVSLKTLNGFLESNKRQQKSILLRKRGLDEIEIHKYYRILVSEINKSMFSKYGKMSIEEVFFLPSYIGWKKKGLAYVVYLILLNEDYEDFLYLQKEYAKFLSKIGYNNQRDFLFNNKYKTKSFLFNYYKLILIITFRFKQKILKKSTSTILLQMSESIKEKII